MAIEYRSCAHCDETFIISVSDRERHLCENCHDLWSAILVHPTGKIDRGRALAALTGLAFRGYHAQTGTYHFRGTHACGHAGEIQVSEAVLDQVRHPVDTVRSCIQDMDCRDCREGRKRPGFAGVRNPME